jgi:membrane fusion protein, multidrug efflux system
MVMARLAIPVIVVACIAGASLLFPAAIRPVGQVAGRLVGLGPAESDAPSAGQSGGAANTSGSARSQAGGRPAAPIAVSVSQVRKAPFPIVVRTFGTVQSPAVVVVGARIASQVTSISVKDGQMVRAGDLLLSLDDRGVQAQLARDKAILAKDSALLVGATADMNRAKDLAAKQAGTQQAYDDALAAQQSAQATVDSDKATVDADRLQLEFTKITAPIDGRLGAVQVSVGDLVGGGSSSASGGTPTAGLVTVTQVDPIEVIFHLPEGNLQIFKPMLDGGTPPRINALVSGTEKIIASGVLDFIDSSVDTTSGTITMRGVFENATAALWPGQYVDLEIEQGAIADATVIPTVAIQSGQNGQFVYLVKDDNTVEVRPVDVALSDGDQSAINSGVRAGDKVVTEGQQRLKPGAVVAPSVAATPDQAADADPLPQHGAPGTQTGRGNGQ